MRRFVLFLLVALLTMGMLTATALAAPDGQLGTERFGGFGKYGIVADGVGLRDSTFGIIDLDVPGTVVKAYLYWSGYDTMIQGSDDTVGFAVDSGSAEMVTADVVYGPDLWFDDYYHYVHVKDVTGLVLSGSHAYTVSEFSMMKKQGAGLIVVYEHEDLPYALVKIYDGLDSFHFRFSPPQGPDTEVTSFDFDPTSCGREMKMTLFVGDIQHDNRPNAVWYQTGSGEKPTNLVDEAGSTEIGGPPYPLGAYDGYEWDTFTGTIEVSAGDTWVCVQLESVDTEPPYGSNNEGLGCSALFLMAGFVLPVPCPSIESYNCAGAVADVFGPGEGVFVWGDGFFGPAEYPVYVVEDVDWVDGMPIPSAIATGTLPVGSSGAPDNPVLLWGSAAPGKYDIVVDVNGNGQYDVCIDALDDFDVETAGFFVIPEFSFGTIMGLTALFAAFGAIFISKSKQKIRIL